MERRNILLVEDQESFRNCAKDYFSGVDIHVDYARDLDEAMFELILNDNYTGILTDCFFPQKTGSNRKTMGYSVCDLIEYELQVCLPRLNLGRDTDYDIPKYVDELRSAIDKSEADQPLGILVASEAERRNIPFLLTTSDNHHGKLADKVHNIVMSRGWPKIMDSYCGSKDNVSFWSKAYRALSEKMK